MKGKDYIYFGKKGELVEEREDEDIWETYLKIGYTSDLPRRLNQHGRSFKLKHKIEGGTLSLESRLHQHFKKYRLRDNEKGRLDRENYKNIKEIRDWFKDADLIDLYRLKPCDKEWEEDNELYFRNFGVTFPSVGWDEDNLFPWEEEYRADLIKIVSKVEQLKWNREKLCKYIQTLPSSIATLIARIGTGDIKRLNYNGRKLYLKLHYGNFGPYLY